MKFCIRIPTVVFAIVFLLLQLFAQTAISQDQEEEKVPSYRISGLAFGDYFYNLTRDEDVLTLSDVTIPGEQDLNGFTMRRIYFTFDSDISKDFTARFRLEGNFAETLTDDKITVFVKDAYIRWIEALGKSDFYFGIQPTPAFDVSEAAWRYRALERTILDLRGIVPARDIAASLRGRLDSAGKYNYAVEFGNGGGNTPETDEFKRLYLHFHWKPTDRFQFTAYQDFRWLPEIPDPNDPALALENDSYTTAFFVNYARSDKYGFGYEGFFRNQKNGTVVGLAAPFEVDTTLTFGHSLWAWYDFNARYGIVGRYDYYDANNNSTVEGNVRNLIIGSFVIRPHKNVWIMPNVFVETYQPTADGRTFEDAVTARITFYYIFQ